MQDELYLDSDKSARVFIRQPLKEVPLNCQTSLHLLKKYRPPKGIQQYFQESLNIMEFRIKYSYQNLQRIHLLNPPWRSCDRIISSNISSCDRLTEQPTEAPLAYCEHQRLELEIVHDFSDDICTLSYCLQTSQLKATNLETTAK